MYAEMPEDCALEMTDLARAGMPREVCGFVMADWGLETVRNIAPDADRAFVMDPDEQLWWIHNHVDDIIGVYHSHPSARSDLSADDKFMLNGLQRQYGFRFWVATVMNVYEWMIDREQAVPAKTNGRPSPSGLAYPVLKAPAAL